MKVGSYENGWACSTGHKYLFVAAACFPVSNRFRIFIYHLRLIPQLGIMNLISTMFLLLMKIENRSETEKTACDEWIKSTTAYFYLFMFSKKFHLRFSVYVCFIFNLYYLPCDNVGKQ